MIDKLRLINIGDTVEYRHEGALLQGCVHGWHLSPGNEHRAIVGSSVYHEHEVSLKSIMKRERLAGAEQGIIVF